jgi:predicted RNase H-like HicB family nuclease
MAVQRVEADDPAVQGILRRPYQRVIEPGEDGVFTATVVEFPGCISEGATPAEAYRNLEEAFADFVAMKLSRGHAIPEPIAWREHSGKITVRLAPSLHAAAARRAEIEGVSLNRLLSEAVARYVGMN